MCDMASNQPKSTMEIISPYNYFSFIGIWMVFMMYYNSRFSIYIHWFQTHQVKESMIVVVLMCTIDPWRCPCTKLYVIACTGPLVILLLGLCYWNHIQRNLLQREMKIVKCDDSHTIHVVRIRNKVIYTNPPLPLFFKDVLCVVQLEN